MHSAPPKAVEKIVGLLIPPASREEVLGDLFERYTSSGQYILEALLVVPMVIASRIRRNTGQTVAAKVHARTGARARSRIGTADRARSR